MNIQELEQTLLARGDDVFSAEAGRGLFTVRKALRGAVYWELTWPDGHRTFHDTLAEADAAALELLLLAGRSLPVPQWRILPR